MITLILLFFLIGILIHCYKETFNYNYWKNRNVKFIKPIPLFGNFLPTFLMQISSGRLLEKIHRQYESEPYIGFYIFNKPALLIKDPKIIELILVKEFTIFNNRSTTSLNKKDILGTYSLFTLKNSEWKTLRNKILPYFSTKQMKLMFELMNNVGENFNKDINEIYNKQINIFEMKNTALKYTLDIIAECVYGIPTPIEFEDITKSIFKTNFIRNFELNSFFFMPFFSALFKLSFIGHKAANYLRTLFWNVLNKNEQEIQNETTIQRHDFINFLIKLRKNKEIDDLHDDKLVAQATIFFAAGVEGASTAISHCLYHLALNPDIQHKLRTEIKQVLADNNNDLTFDNIKQMIYLDACVRETFRMAIALSFIDRLCKEDYKVPGTDLVIEKGMSVFISLFGMHYDPKYFTNPNRFDPERFLSNKSEINPFAYLPFGLGQHKCIGYRFAVIQVKIGLIYILKDFHVEAAKKFEEPFKPHPRGFFWTLVNGCNLRLKKDKDVND